MRKTRRKSHSQFLEELKQKRGDEYTPLDEYKYAREKIRFKHNVCGQIIEMSPDNMLRGKNCVHCSTKSVADKKLKPEGYWEEAIREQVGDEYTLLEPGKYGHRKHKIRHNACGNEYEVSLDKFLSGRRCPKCSKSHGEQHIAKWLDDNGISYSQEVRFSDCRNKQPLPFDFMVFRENGTYFLIEYDGRQHFPDGLSSYEPYEVRKEKDDIKTNYCLSKNIELYRIPYTLYDRPGQGNNRINERLKEICGNC